MKRTLTILAIIFAISAQAQTQTQTQTQTQKQDSLVIHFEMDTTTFKNIELLIRENISSNTLTGKMVLQNIFQPFYQSAKFEPRSKPKETVSPKKN